MIAPIGNLDANELAFCPRCGGEAPLPDGHLWHCVCFHTAFGGRLDEPIPKRLLIPEDQDLIPEDRHCTVCHGLAPVQDGTPNKCGCPHDRWGKLPLWLVEDKPNPDQPDPTAETQSWIVPADPASVPAADLEWLCSPTLISIAKELLSHTPWPLDYIGPSLLAVCGSCIGNTRQLRITDLWSERAALWIGLIGASGSYKTPVINFATKPLLQLQREAHDVWKTAYAKWKTDQAMWENMAAKYRGERPVKPTQVKRVVANFTMEKLVPMLSENPRGMLLRRDELLGWILSMNQYKNGVGDDRQNWLSIWSSVDLMVDLKGDDFSMFVPSPFVCILGGIQPGPLGKIRQDSDDGLVERLLYFWPDCAPGKIEDIPFPDHIRREYTAFLKKLIALQPGQDEEGKPVALQVRMADEAFKVFSEREWAIKQQAAKDDAPPTVINALQKSGGQAARLALVLHHCLLADGVPVKEFEIDETVMDAAWHITECSYAHLRRAIDAMATKPSDLRAERAVAWIRRHGGTATARELITGKVVGVRKSSEARELLEDLADRHLGILHTDTAGNREQVRFILPNVSPL